MGYKVYLAGPIRGLSFKEGSEWRIFAKRHLALFNIDCYSPLRGKENLLSHLAQIDSNQYPVNHVLTMPPGILTRDSFDVSSSDLILVNLIGAKNVSIGTVSEIAWAWLLRKPIVLAMEEGNPHQHAFIEAEVPFIVPTIEEAIELVKLILLP